ncbi:hypothetical protein [Paracoccus marcusii]|uniref:hypothetical protein n=1 Tax=Paracoccus marcusii TaxID=59779 RepID=UPI0035A59855
MNKFPPVRPEDLPEWSGIGEYFGAVRSNLDGPMPLFINAADKAMGILIRNLSSPGKLRAVGLINYAYSNWRSAVVLAQAGCVHQLPLVLRPSLEALTYAHLFASSSEWQTCWENRHTTKAAAQKFRKDGPKAARDFLKKSNTKLAAEIASLTEDFVDFGGHPNIGAIEHLSSYYTNPTDSNSAFVVFDQLAGEEKRYQANIWILQFSGIILDLLKMMWPERYMLLRIEDMDKTYRRLGVEFIRANQFKRKTKQE